VIGVPFAHIAGIPIEETLVPIIPALVLAVGVASATIRARLRRGSSRRRGLGHLARLLRGDSEQ
jgi:hypothetical protein